MERVGWVEKYVKHFYKPKQRLTWRVLQEYVADNQITDDKLIEFAQRTEGKYIVFKYPY